MCAIDKCLLYAFLCLAIFCGIDSKGQIPNDGVINIDDTLKGEVIEGSGRSGEEDDVDQEQYSSGGTEDDEDTPLLSSLTPGVPTGVDGGSRSRTISFEPGSGLPPVQGNHNGDDVDDLIGPGVTLTTTATASSSSPSSPSSSTDDDEIPRRRFFASNPPPPPSLPPASPSSTLSTARRKPSTATTTVVPTTTTATTTPITTATPPRSPFERGVDDEDDDNFLNGVPSGGGEEKLSRPSSTTTTTTTPTTTITTTATTTTPEYKRLVNSVDYPDEIDDGDDDFGDDFGWGSGLPTPSGGGGGGGGGSVRGKGEVSKPPTTVYKPTKPYPTKFVTHVDGKITSQPEHKDKMNELPDEDEDDWKNRDNDDYIGNKIPSIGQAVLVPKQQRNDSSLWKQPGILAGIIGAAVVGLLCAVLLVMFIVYRMKKKDEGSYDLDETTKRSPRINGYQRTNQNEFYA